MARFKTVREVHDGLYGDEGGSRLTAEGHSALGCPRRPIWRKGRLLGNSTAARMAKGEVHKVSRDPRRLGRFTAEGEVHRGRRRSTADGEWRRGRFMAPGEVHGGSYRDGVGPRLTAE